MPLAPPPHQHPPLASRPAPRPASHDLFSTRQSASTFNQPLGFDTSSVRSMGGMFSVRSARALWPPAFSVVDPPRACRGCTTTAPTPPSHLPARTSPRFVCAPCDSAASVIVQPAAEFRHVQGDKHAHHVYGALSRVPWLPAFHPRAATLVPPSPPAPPASPRSALRPTSHALLTTRHARARRRSTSR